MVFLAICVAFYAFHIIFYSVIGSIDASKSMHIEAHLDNLEVKLFDRERDYAQVQIKGNSLSVLLVRTIYIIFIIMGIVLYCIIILWSKPSRIKTGFVLIY